MYEEWVNWTVKKLGVGFPPILPVLSEVLALLSNFSENRFTGESFLLLDDEIVKELGIKIGGQMLIRHLLVEVCVCIKRISKACTVFNNLKTCI